MKRRYNVLIIVLFIVTIFIIFIFSNSKNKITPSYQYIDSVEKVYVFYVKEERTYGIKLEKKSDNDYSLIEEVFDYLTIDSNYAPLLYRSYVPVNTKLLSYELINNKIILNISNEFLYCEDEYVKYALSCIYETYKMLGFEEVSIEINGYTSDYLAGYNLSGDFDTLTNIEVIDTIDAVCIKVYKLIDEDILTFENIITQEDDYISFVIDYLILDSEYDVIYENNIISLIDVTDDSIVIYFKDIILEENLIYEMISLNFPQYDISFKIN